MAAQPSIWCWRWARRSSLWMSTCHASEASTRRGGLNECSLIHVIGLSFHDDRHTLEAMKAAGSSAFLSKTCVHLLPS